MAVPAHLLLAEPLAAAEWWPAVRSGTVRVVSLGAEEGAADRQFLARLWRAGVAPGHIALEELAALLCWQPARLLGLPAKGASTRAATPTWRCSTRRSRHPAMNRKERNPGPRRAPPTAPRATGRRGAVVRVLRGGEDAAAGPGRWIRATPAREPL